MNKKIVLCVICCAILLWCFRIISVNKDIKPEHQIQMGEEYQLKDVSIVPAEAHLFSHDEFLEHFNLTDDEVSQYDKRDC